MTNKKNTKNTHKNMRHIHGKKTGSQKNLETESGGGRGVVSKIVSPKSGNYLIPLLLLTFRLEYKKRVFKKNGSTRARTRSLGKMNENTFQFFPRNSNEKRRFGIYISRIRGDHQKRQLCALPALKSPLQKNPTSYEFLTDARRTFVCRFSIHHGLMALKFIFILFFLKLLDSKAKSARKREFVEIREFQEFQEFQEFRQFEDFRRFFRKNEDFSPVLVRL